MPRQLPPRPGSFAAVLEEELAVIRQRRELRGEDGREPAGETPVERAHAAQLMGLAFSGGGIRSATFNLGVAGALARLGLLRRFDYLSVNSGGGYLGGWLTAWIRRAGIERVEAELAGMKALPGGAGPAADRGAAGAAAAGGAEATGAAAASPGEAPARETAGAAPQEPQPVSWLRQFSNYLTPQVGAFTADTWTLVATYLRNLLLNQTILVLALAAVLLSPRLVMLLAEAVPRTPWLGLPLSLASLGLALAMMGLNLSTMAAGNHQQSSAAQPWYTRLGWVQALVVVPLFVAAWQAGLWIWYLEAPAGDWTVTGWLADRWPWLAARVAGEEAVVEPLVWALMAAALYSAVWLLACALGFLRLWRRGDGARTRFARLWAVLLLSALPAGAAGGLLLWLLTVATHAAGLHLGEPVPWHLFHVNVWNAPAIILIFLLTAFLHTGLTGRIFIESYREWWSRLGAWMMIYGITWIGLFGMAVYGPILVLWVKSAAAAAGFGWLTTTVGGVLVGKRSQAPGGRPGITRRLLLAAAPQVFIVGLLALVALGLHVVLAPDPAGVPDGCDWLWAPAGTGVGRMVECQTARMKAATAPGGTGLLLAALLGSAAFLSWRVDINQFSMHPFYRNRLIRAYLGASNRDRRPQPFTAFDPADDLPLAGMVPARGYDGPFPVFNAALNLVAGDELAWQERMAASFVFTPLASGYEVGPVSGATSRLRPSGYRPTAGYLQTRDGLTVGTAVGISGAAVSPSMGAQSKADLAFLLTVFNVRLGWWLGNPRDDRTWYRMGPKFGLATLLSELLGFTDESSRFVYLSDGGHFDNLGLYELVRRRCRFIVLTDAGADPSFTFSDLGGAIRKCRTDFGVEIEIDVSRLRLEAGSQTTPWHCAVGLIRYDRADPGATPGTLVYLKASLTGDEPEDVLNYAAGNPGFPHEATSDQWFGESQFESYRRLGDHIAEVVFTAASDDPGTMAPEALFVRLREAWYPPSPGAREFFARNSERLGAMLERLRTDPDLAFLTAQLYPDWDTLTRHLHLDGGDRGALPDRPAQLRSGLYFCTALIQLLEGVYLDLDLERAYCHPDNRGWMNLMRFWSGSTMFRVAWAVNVPTFGARFQSFAERRCGLTLGEVACREVPLEPWPGERLSRREEEILRALLPSREAAGGRLFAFDLLVPQHRGRDEGVAREDAGAEGASIPVGFALARGGRIAYFRVREHLRRAGLARRALEILVRDFALTERAEAELPAVALEGDARAEVARFDRLLGSVRMHLAAARGMERRREQEA